ncbi:hypothetical protein AHAS_Ahas06G0137000 [Arachis hypogaea]
MASMPHSSTSPLKLLKAQNSFLRSPNLPPHFDIVDLLTIDISNLVNSKISSVTHLYINTNESLKYLNKVLNQLPNKPQVLIIDIFCTQVFEACKDSLWTFHIWFRYRIASRLKSKTCWTKSRTGTSVFGVGDEVEGGLRVGCTC